MMIKTINSERIVEIGSNDILFSLYSTIMVRLQSDHSEIKEAVMFLQTGVCKSGDALECARQFNLIRDKLSQISPNDAIYDMNDLSKKAPWEGQISPIVTSCGNMYTTTDGKDLLYEVVCVLTYAHYCKVDVKIEN